MATRRAKAFIHGTKERQRLAAAKKQNVFIKDRVRAKRAKTYVYSNKESKRLAAVLDVNLYINDCMTCVRPDPAPYTYTITAACNTYCLPFALCCLSVFVLCTVYCFRSGL